MTKNAETADIPKEVALALCAKIRSENRGKWYTFNGLWCLGCAKFSGGDPAKMCVSNAPDCRGCLQVNARYDRSRAHG